MMTKPTIGLLPLYLQLYDERMPELRAAFDSLLATVSAGFTSRGIAVQRADVCRVEDEVSNAVASFEQSGACLIVTLHLAYSPSLESADCLVRSPLPVLLLDTTMDHDFGLDADPARIMYDHGVHGVQDLASVLRRCGKHYEIVAGHVTRSNVLVRAVGAARAAYAAKLLASMRTLRIGETFHGMGDFAVADRLLEALLGIAVEQKDMGALEDAAREVSNAAIDAELAADRLRYEVVAREEVHRRSVRVGLALRRVLEEGTFGAFTFNFGAFNSGEGPVDTVPFLEASKAMARGLGYAGEGDALTAALVGVVNHAFGRTTFTEIFCPDWKGNALFISHMGEVNPETASETPRLIEKEFPWTGARNPAVLTCAPAPGPAVLVNLAPGPDNRFGLIVAPVEVLGDGTHPAMRDNVRGWILPQSGTVAEWLECYSQCGGTHHSALVLGDHADSLEVFGRFAGLEVVRL